MSAAPAADAVAGASGGGPLATQGPAGGALAGATGAASSDQLLASLQDILAKLTALIQQLQASVTGGGATGTPAASSCGCCGASDAKAGAGFAQTDAPPTSSSGDSGSGGAAAAPPIPAAAPSIPAAAPAASAASATSTLNDALVSKWVTGEAKGLNPKLLNGLAKVGEALGKQVKIDSGKRSREEQQVLYNRYLAGTGNLAAKPGSSNHESGNAADVSVGGVSLRNSPQGSALASKFGLAFPVSSEAWHTELAK